MSVQFEGSSSSLSDEDEDKDVRMSAKFVADNQTQKRRCRLPSGLRRCMHKFLIWKLICLVGFGSYYCYNIDVHQTIIEHALKVNVFQYNLLYSIYSWPNVIFPLIGGVLIDRLVGIRWGTIIFAAFVCLGQLLFAMGGMFKSFTVMLIGRFLFGVGGETVVVAQNKYLVLWFKGWPLNMVFGTLLMTSYAANVFKEHFGAMMYEVFDKIRNDPVRIGLVSIVGFLICAASLSIAFILGLLDYRAVKTLKRGKEKGERIRCKKFMNFPLSLWVIFVVCVAYYVTVLPFIGLSSLFLQTKYGLLPGDTEFLNSFVYTASAIVSPIFGLLSGLTGFNLVWMNCGIIATLVAHAAFAFLGPQRFIPYIATVIMGISYSIIACTLLPLVAYIVPEQQLGTAYGLMLSIHNLGLAVVDIVVGLIADNLGYLMLETIFLVILSVALFAGIFLYILDFTVGNNKMNMSFCARMKLEKQRRE